MKNEGKPTNKMKTTVPIAQNIFPLDVHVEDIAQLMEKVIAV